MKKNISKSYIEVIKAIGDLYGITIHNIDHIKKDGQDFYALKMEGKGNRANELVDLLEDNYLYFSEGCYKGYYFVKVDQEFFSQLKGHLEQQLQYKDIKQATEEICGFTISAVHPDNQKVSFTVHNEQKATTLKEAFEMAGLDNCHIGEHGHSNTCSVECPKGQVYEALKMYCDGTISYESD